MNATEASPSPSLENKPREGFPRPPFAVWASIAAVVAVLCLAYLPNLQALVHVWNVDPDYSHGFVVIPIALWILWRNWPETLVRSSSWPGWALVAVSIGLRLLFHARGNTWSENATLFPLVVGLGLARLGWKNFLKVWPAFSFLIFLFPLPAALNTTLSQPLQKVATTFSCLLLKATGLWVMSEGNIIMVNSERLEVQEACNGLAMLMSLAATVVAAASLFPLSLLKRIILLLSIIPVALLSNILRITATAWCYHLYGREIGSEYAHDIAGWLMMPTAMILVGLEMLLVSWLFVESVEETREPGLLGLAQTRPNLAGGAR